MIPVVITREYSIDYAHRIHKYRGKCSNLHGHTARVIVTFTREILDPLGMIEDFVALDMICKPILGGLDHRLVLAEDDPHVAVLKHTNENYLVISAPPTAEVLSAFLFNELTKALVGLRTDSLKITSVAFYETPKSAAICTGKFGVPDIRIVSNI